MLKLVAKAAIDNPNALQVESGMGLAMLRPGSKVDNLMKDGAKMDMESDSTGEATFMKDHEGS